MRIKIRIGELEPGNIFEMNGVEFRVKGKDSKEIHFNNRFLYGNKNKCSRGIKSQLLVWKIIADVHQIYNDEVGFIRPQAIYSNKTF
jgi:hypothetical protein